MKAAQWIDLVKIYREWGSDYRTAKELSLSRNTISMYRSRTPTMDEETAVVVADALEINPSLVILDQIAERSKSHIVREALEQYIVKDADDVMSTGFTAVMRAEIRADIELNGIAAITPPKYRKSKQAGFASVTFSAILATIAAITTSFSPNAEATSFSSQTAYYVK